MKAMELRIGNYIENTDSQMASYMVVNADVIKQNEHTMYASLEPIPLTEEWLIKFGFEKLNTKMSDCFVFQKGLWRVAIKDNIEKNNEWVLWHERISPPTWCLSRFEYIHQLQNLYFALTGEELTLKP